MKKKNDFAAFIAKNWFYYVLWLVLVIFAWEGIFSFITKPKKEESVFLFFGVEEVQTDTIYSELKVVKPEYVKTIDITARSSRTEGFDSLFATRGIQNGDVFVLPESFCEQSVMQSCFYPMDPNVVKELFGENVDCGKATVDNKVYGIKIYDKETNKGRAEEYFTYLYTDNDGVKQTVGDYYLFFGKKSLHLGILSDSKFDGALILAQAIWNKGAE